MIGTELDRSVDDELVAEVNAVRDAGEERRARYFDSPERQARTNAADEKRGHAERNERKLPDAGRNGEIVLAQIKTVHNGDEAGQPEPARRIHEPLPPVWAKFLDRRHHDAEHERIEPRPGGIVDPELEPAVRNAGVAGVSPGEKGAERDPAQNDSARNNDARTLPPANQQENQGQRQVELVFDRERPGVRESGAAVQADVLHRDEEFPERRNLRKFAHGRQGKVNREDDEVSRQDAQGAAHKEAREVDALPTLKRREQLSADEITAEDEEEIDPDPAEAMPVAWEREAE